MCHGGLRGGAGSTAAVADNIVVQSELKVLPVPPGRQVKPSYACLSAPCLPPLLSHVFGLCPRRQREHRAFVKQCPPSDRQLMSIGASEHRAFVRAKARFAGPKGSGTHFVRRNAVIPDILLAAFSPISVMTSWPTWAAMAGGHNRRGPTWGVGHARRSWNAVRDDHPRPSLTGNAARALPSAAFTSARCEPFSVNRLTPAPCDSGCWPGAMAAGAQEQAASCDAFVLSRRPPAPGAPPSRTSPLCLIAKPFPEPSPNHGPVLGRDCRGEFRRARSRTPPLDSVLAVGDMTDGVWQGGSVMSTPRRGPCRASRHDRG